jgi:hypothetical protein
VLQPLPIALNHRSLAQKMSSEGRKLEFDNRDGNKKARTTSDHGLQFGCDTPASEFKASTLLSTFDDTPPQVQPADAASRALGFKERPVRRYLASNPAHMAKFARLFPLVIVEQLKNVAQTQQIAFSLTQNYEGAEKTNERIRLSALYAAARLSQHGHAPFLEALQKISAGSFVVWVYEEFDSKGAHVDEMLRLWKMLMRLPRDADKEHCLMFQVSEFDAIANGHEASFVAEIVMFGPQIIIVPKEYFNFFKHAMPMPKGPVQSWMASFNCSPRQALLWIKQGIDAGASVGLDRVITWQKTPRRADLPLAEMNGFSNEQCRAGGIIGGQGGYAVTVPRDRLALSMAHLQDVEKLAEGDDCAEQIAIATADVERNQTELDEALAHWKEQRVKGGQGAGGSAVINPRQRLASSQARLEYVAEHATGVDRDEQIASAAADVERDQIELAVALAHFHEQRVKAGTTAVCMRFVCSSMRKN